MTSVGSGDARTYVVGLTPAASGASRVGRMFTKDRSGDWLQAAFHRMSLVASSTPTVADDGQRLTRARMGAAIWCAPPTNKPTTIGRITCALWLAREIVPMPEAKVPLTLGGIGWGAILRVIQEAGWIPPCLQSRFGHGATAELTRSDGRAVTLLGSYHPNQQSTFTDRLTEVMLDDVLEAAKRLTET